MNYPTGTPIGGTGITNSYAAFAQSALNGPNTAELTVAQSNDTTQPFSHIQWLNLSSSDFTISVGSNQQGKLICPAQSAFLVPMKANSFAVSFTALNQYVNVLRTDDR